VDQPTTLHIGRALGCANLTVGQGRRRSRRMGSAGLQDARRAGRPRALAPPTRVQVIAVASTLPHDHDRPVTRWTLHERVAPWLEALATDSISRSRLWRLRHDGDLTPHKSAYWLTSHDEDGDAKAQTMCPLYAQALETYQQGRRVLCCEEKTGRHILERKAPLTPAQAGRRERREHASIRHGTRGLIHTVAVATGPRAWTIGSTRTATDCVAHLTQASHGLPALHRYNWVMDNCNTPWSLAVCRVVARWCQGPFAPHTRTTGPHRRALLTDPSHRHVFHGTPKHGAWLHQAEVFFGVLHRRFVARGSFPSAKDCVRRLERFVQDDHTRHAHPYRWTYLHGCAVRARHAVQSYTTPAASGAGLL
jgi:transposase